MANPVATRTKQALFDRWNRFWLRPMQTDTLCLLRLFFGLVLFLRFTGGYGLYRINRIKMTFPHGKSFDVHGLLDEGVFRMPYPGFDWLPVPNALWYDRIELSLMILAVFVMLGLFTRVAVPLLAVLFTYIHLISMWSFRHHYLSMFIVLWVLAFSRCDLRYSIDARLREPLKPRPLTTITPLRLLQTLVCLMFFFTFLAKLNPGWLSGDIIKTFDESGSIRPLFREFTLSILSYQQLSLCTLIVEGFLPFGLAFPKTRRAAIFLGLALHIGIDALIAVATYGMQMAVLYIAFIHPESKSTKVVYDSASERARRYRRWFEVLDWFDRFNWLDVRSTAAQAALPAVGEAHRIQHLYVVASDRSVKRGFAAWRHLLNTCPLTFMPSALLYIPPISQLGEWIYDRSSRTRTA